MELNLKYDQILELIRQLSLELEQRLKAEIEKDIHLKTKAKAPVRKAGSLKGFIQYMANDFNEPLDDMKDYM